MAESIYHELEKRIDELRDECVKRFRGTARQLKFVNQKIANLEEVCSDLQAASDAVRSRVDRAERGLLPEGSAGTEPQPGIRDRILASRSDKTSTAAESTATTARK